MRFIIEIEGVVLNLRPAYTALHKSVAEEVGWSHLHANTFWRTLRKGDKSAVIPGGPPSKVAAYEKLFSQRLDEDELIATLTPHEGAMDALRTLSDNGSVCFVTSGSNRGCELAGPACWSVGPTSRSKAMTGFLKAPDTVEVHALSTEVDKRPGELRILAGADERCLVVASTDTLLRTAELAGVFSVGISSGVCSAPRLHQSGADVVYPGITDLADSISGGAGDLIRAGLLPAPLG